MQKARLSRVGGAGVLLVMTDTIYEENPNQFLWPFSDSCMISGNQFAVYDAFWSSGAFYDSFSTGEYQLWRSNC